MDAWDRESKQWLGGMSNGEMGWTDETMTVVSRWALSMKGEGPIGVDIGLDLSSGHG